MTEAPDHLSIGVLTEGYIVQFRGATFAAGNITQTNKIVREILKQLKAQRKSASLKIPAPQVQQVQPTPVQPRAEHHEAPTQVQPVPSTGAIVPDEVVDLSKIDMAASRENLRTLVLARFKGEISDRTFYDYTAVHCPGITEDEIVDSLDAAFEGPEDATAGGGAPPVFANTETEVPAQGTTRPAGAARANGRAVPAGGRPSGMQIIEDLQPNQMVEDFLSDASGRPIQYDDDDLPPDWR